MLQILYISIYFLADGSQVFQERVILFLFEKNIDHLVVALISSMEIFQVHYCSCHT